MIINSSVRRRWLARSLAGLGVVASALMATAGVASAQTASEKVDALATQTNLLWVVIGAVLVIFMQAGFAWSRPASAAPSTPRTSSRRTSPSSAWGSSATSLVGFPSCSAASATRPLGMTTRRSATRSSARATGSSCGRAAGRSPTSAKPAAPRCGLLPLHGGLHGHRGHHSRPGPWRNAGSGTRSSAGACSAAPIYYPIFGAWTWGGGWLAKVGESLHLGLGYVDFAGSGVVHAVGGVAGLAGAIVLGPRIGKFNKDGSANTIPGHHIPMAMLGMLHPAVRLVRLQRGVDLRRHRRAVRARRGEHRLSPAPSAPSRPCSGLQMQGTGKPDPGMMVNGMLAGLVAITAPCAFVDPWAAAVIGVIAGLLVIGAAGFIENVSRSTTRSARSPFTVCAVQLRRALRRHLLQRHVRRWVERHDRRRGRRRKGRHWHLLRNGPRPRPARRAGARRRSSSGP